MTSLRDVARQAGISVATASRVINHPEKVSKSTREKVEQAMNEILYVQKNSTVEEKIAALFIPDLQNPVFTRITEEVESRVKNLGWSILVCTTSDNLETERRHAHEFFSHNIKSLIFVSSVAANSSENYPHYKALIRSGARLLFINGAPRNVKVTSISDDELLAGQIAVEYLLQLGHRKIGFITGKRTSSPRSTLRLSAIKSELEKYENASVKTIYGNWGHKGGYESFAQLYKLHPKMTAIICASDLQAIGVLQYCNENGIHVPEELSVIGSDGIDQGDWVSPPLTSVQLPFNEIANAVSQWLNPRTQANFLTPNSVEILFKPHLIERKSANKPPKGNDVKET
jgi:DNA-binding LacI/PurR family transcriptional regulator